jgi:prophage antirepressor-like protein
MEVVKAFSSNNLHTNITIRGTFEKPLFRAIDIGEVLEIKNIRSHISSYTETEKVNIISESNGGMQNVSFLTENGLYKILFKSRTDIAKVFQDWVCNVIVELRLTGIYDLNKKLQEEKEKMEQEKKQLEDEKRILQEKLEEQSNNSTSSKKENKPVIYIYNLDTRMEIPELKIGYTTNIHNRIKPYNQTHKFGKKEFEIEIENIEVKSTEHFLHLLLKKYKIADEVFKLPISVAKMIVIKLVNLINVINITNEAEKEQKLLKMVETEYSIISNDASPKISTATIETQTDLGLEQSVENIMTQINDSVNVKKTELEKSFDNFIKEHCIVRPDVEVSSTDIIGQYRIINKKASQENYLGFKSYLATCFKQIRLKKQDKDQTVYGYLGIKLKNIEYKKNIQPCDSQTFIFSACIFTPSGKTLIGSLVTEYAKWKKSLKKEYENEKLLKQELRSYLKNSNYVLYTTIWATGGGGQGYYGLLLKSDIDTHRMTSSTGKRVYKIDLKTKEVLQTWETIAKAATAENTLETKMCPTRMTRAISNKTEFNNDYYYSCVNPNS